MDAITHVISLAFAVPYSPPAGEQPDRERLAAGHERCELVTAGRGWVEHRGTWTEVTAGCLVWNVAGDYTIGRSDVGKPVHCLAFDFTVTKRRRLASRFSRWADPDELDAFVRQIGRLTARPTLDRQALAGFIYTTLLLQARIWQAHDQVPEIPLPLRRVAAMIDGGYAQSLDIPAMARIVGWSPSHLHAQFQRHFSTTPHQYMMRRRVQAVREALLKHGQGLAEIASATGFADARTLIRAFRRQMGKSPGRWRAGRST